VKDDFLLDTTVRLREVIFVSDWMNQPLCVLNILWSWPGFTEGLFIPERVIIFVISAHVFVACRRSDYATGTQVQSAVYEKPESAGGGKTIVYNLWRRVLWRHRKRNGFFWRIYV